MKAILRKIFFLLISSAAFLYAGAQPFANEIQSFKKQDSLQAPAKNAILFVGSSSFRIWTTVQADFPGYTIINRGFGGSTFLDVIRYTNDIVISYHPKQVVIYCGDNDLASSSAITADTVLGRFKQLFGLIRAGLPGASVLYVSIKPSPSRAQLMPAMEKANTLIRDFLRLQQNTDFADVYHAMLNADGKPVDDLFKEDKLHMNAKGYAIWTKIIQPYLLKP